MSTVAHFEEMRHAFSELKDSCAEQEICTLLSKYEKSCEGVIQKAKKIDDMERKLAETVRAKTDLNKSLQYTRSLLRTEVQARREAQRRMEDMRMVYVQLIDMLKNTTNLNDEAKKEFSMFLALSPRRSPLNINYEHKYNNYLDSFPNRVLVSQKLFPSRTKPQNESEYNAALYSNMSSFSGAEAQTDSTSSSMEDKVSVDGVRSTLPSQSSSTEHISNEGVTLKLTNHNNLMSQARTSNAEATTDRPRYMMWRQHYFLPKSFLATATCLHCQKKIRFGTLGLRCRNCPLRCHTDCRHLLDVSCVPNVSNNTVKKRTMKSVADYAPNTSPMIPAPIVYCVNEIEKRGLNEPGLYSISGPEPDVKSLKGKFLRGKGIPYLANLEIHVIASCIKDFLRSFRESLIPPALWRAFASAVEDSDNAEGHRQFVETINKLPQPNRDTLAFLMIHFQHVGESIMAQMPIERLVRALGPIIVGFSSLNPDSQAVLTELSTQFAIMKSLLVTPSGFWLRTLNLEAEHDK